MKFMLRNSVCVSLSLCSLIVLAARTAHADVDPSNPPPVTGGVPVAAAPVTPPAPAPAPATPVVMNPQPAPGAAPPANTGFQMALRMGYAIPLGSATGAKGDDLSKSFGGQVPFLAELGGKITPNILIGGYLGLAFGGYGSAADAVCKPSNASCLTASFRIGAQIQYHILPAEKLNPWIGYGIGIESSAVAVKSPTIEASVAALGIDFAHFTAGFDYRLNKQVGIGPVVDLSVGQYSKVVQKVNGQELSGDIKDKALHQWLTFGVRLVLFP
jgi:hypothetical protein